MQSLLNLEHPQNLGRLHKLCQLSHWHYLLTHITIGLAKKITVSRLFSVSLGPFPWGHHCFSKRF